MPKKHFHILCWAAVCATLTLSGAETAKKKNPLEGKPRLLKALNYGGDASLTTDLGVGLWASPLPYDYNGDGHTDLFVVGYGSPESKDLYYFENTGKKDPKTGAPLFKKAVPVDPAVIGPDGVRQSHAHTEVTPSYLWKNGRLSMRVMSPQGEFPDFFKTGLANPVPRSIGRRDVYNPSGNHRGQRWSYVDWNGDGVLDLMVGMGDWTDYGWDNAYDSNGRWRNGPLHGFVFVMLNRGTDEAPKYDAPMRVEADKRHIDMYGNPAPNFADFRGNGVRDLICGEFLDGLTYFQNVGDAKNPRFLKGVPVRDSDGELLKMHIQMIEPVAYDWDGDGRADIVVGQEDGTVVLLRNEGFEMAAQPLTDKERKDKVKKPDLVVLKFSKPIFLRQQADLVKFGILTTPVCVDWDGDGLVDILTGNGSGEIGFIKNLGGNGPLPVFAEPQFLEADGERIRYMAGYNGSIQGPAEAKWGYTNIGMGDWDGDGLLDIVASTIQGKIYLHKNIGTKTQPKLARGEPLKVAWDGPAPKPAWNWWDPQDGELVVQWRCTPVMVDVDGDGIMDLVTVDHEGYLAWYRQVEKDGKRVLQPGQRIFKLRALNKEGAYEDAPWRMSAGASGKSGRRTYCFVDWDGDGKLDILFNGPNAEFYKNVSEKPGEWVFENKGPMDGVRLAGHSTAPGTVDWNGDGIPDLVIGAEDGYFYYLENPRSQKND